MKYQISINGNDLPQLFSNPNDALNAGREVRNNKGEVTLTLKWISE